MTRLPSGRGGFTLLEVIVSLSIMAMIAACLAVSFRLVTNSIERGESAARDMARLRAGLSLLDRSLRQASPATLPKENEAAPYFIGEEEKVRLLSASPMSSASGGAFRLLSIRGGVLPTGERGMLMSESSPFRIDGARDWEGENDPRLFLPGATEVTFAYSGGPDEQGQWDWLRTWDAEEQKGLPAAIRVRFVTDGEGGRRESTVYVPVPAGGNEA